MRERTLLSSKDVPMGGRDLDGLECYWARWNVAQPALESGTLEIFQACLDAAGESLRKNP